MRKSFASAMLGLLLLLSVAAVRCDAQCTLARMPMVMQPAQSADSDLSMHSGMEHCAGMQSAHDDMPVADAGCATPICQHQVLPSSADSRIDVDGAQLLQPISLQITDAVVRTHPAPKGFDRPPLPLRSPLDQSSSLRV